MSAMMVAACAPLCAAPVSDQSPATGKYPPQTGEDKTDQLAMTDAIWKITAKSKAESAGAWLAFARQFHAAC